MKNKLRFVAEVLFTLILAGILSSGFGVLLVFTFGNFGKLESMYPSINATMGVVFGLVVGYKLNTLIRKHKF